MTTLREHLEAIRDRHSPEPDSEDTWCQLCAGPYRGVPHPCPDHEHAVAALAILDAENPWSRFTDEELAVLEICTAIPAGLRDTAQLMATALTAEIIARQSGLA